MLSQLSSFCARTPLKKKNLLANGERYPLVGGMRKRHFDGTSFKPHKLPENAQTPTSRVHALLGNLTERKTHCLKLMTIAYLAALLHVARSLAIAKKH